MSKKIPDKRFITEPYLFDYVREPVEDMTFLHFHDTYEIYFLSEGRRRYLIDHGIYEVTEGDILLIPPNTVHCTKNTDFPTPFVEGEMHERYLLAPRDIPQNLRRLFTKHHYVLKEEDKHFVLCTMKNIEREMASYDDYSFQMYKVYLNSILILLARKYFDSAAAPATPDSRKISGIIQDIVNYIHENIDKDISLSAIADKFGYSKEYLSAEFKKAVGNGYSEYLNAVRIAKSSELLTTTNLPIKDIAVMCGYRDSNYFAAVFKKEMLISPTEYRLKASSF